MYKVHRHTEGYHGFIQNYSKATLIADRGAAAQGPGGSRARVREGAGPDQGGHPREGGRRDDRVHEGRDPRLVHKRKVSR